MQQQRAPAHAALFWQQQGRLGSAGLLGCQGCLRPRGGGGGLRGLAASAQRARRACQRVAIAAQLAHSRTARFGQRLLLARPSGMLRCPSPAFHTHARTHQHPIPGPTGLPGRQLGSHHRLWGGVEAVHSAVLLLRPLAPGVQPLLRQAGGVVDDGCRRGWAAAALGRRGECGARREPQQHQRHEHGSLRWQDAHVSWPARCQECRCS